MLRCAMVGTLLFVLLVGGAASSASNSPIHHTPHLGVVRGNHHVDLRVELRYRWEDWKAFTTDWEDFHGVRARLGVDYRYRDRLQVVVQGQQTALLDLSSDSSGAAALYRSNNDQDSHPASLHPSQFYLRWSPDGSDSIQLGRAYVNMGTLIPYTESHWRFVKLKRLSQRLLGTVGWTHGERAYDGASVQLASEAHQLHVFVLEPTTGVFVVDNEAYERQRDVWAAGVDWTLRRGAWLDDTEIGAFGIAYSDQREADDVAGLFGDIEVYTLGGSWLGFYPLGPGRVDVLLWGALQLGHYDDTGPASGTRERDQLAGAAIGEVGYQLPDAPGKPWLRVGMNWASGDSDLDDDDRHTFFNILPTNHLYYGYADQLAFQNLLDLLVQLKIAVRMVGLEITYHRFWLDEDDDFRWAGTGAFARGSLGYVRNASNGSSDVGHELDVVFDVPLRPWVALSLGYAKFWGGDAFDGQPHRDVRFGYVQLIFRY